MAPKKLLIKMSIPKALQLTAKEEAELKRGFKTVAVRVVKTASASSNINVINSVDVITVNRATGATRKRATKAKAKK